MGGAPLLLAIAVVTVDAGWESDGRDGYRYIIQIPAEQLREVERTGQITSQLPEDLRGRVSSVVVQVGDDPLPRPAVPPRADSASRETPESSDSESSAADSPDTELSAAGPAKTYLPSPDETVRAQGDANGFGLPDTNASAGPQSPPDSSANFARLAATDRGSRVETPPAGQGAGANSYGTSQFNGFETQSRSNPAAPTTSATNSSNVPSTSRSSSSGNASNPPATGFAAADGSRDNRWFTGPQNPNASDTANTTGSPAATAQPPASNSSATATPPASNPNPPASSPNPPASNPNPPASSPPATRQEDSASAPPAAASPWSLPREERSSASNPPSQSSNPPSLSDGRSAETRQEAADRRLLEEVGIDASGHAYDKRTNQPLYENDERYPLIVDYVRRMEQAEKDRERQRATALPGRSVYDDRRSVDDRYPPAARTATPAASEGRSAWDYASNGYDPRSGLDPRGGLNGYPNNYGASPSYNPNPSYTGYPQSPANQPPANQPPAGNWQPDPRVAQNPPATVPTTPASTSQPPATETPQPRSESPSDADLSSRSSKSRDASVKTQPLFMFMLLLSIVGNIYLGIAISRLIRRYRNLVSTHRGTALPT